MVEICRAMNIFERMAREWFPTVSSHARTRGHQKKLRGRTKKGRGDAFPHILQFSCGTSCCRFLLLWKVYLGSKISRQIHRSKIHQRALTENNILAQKVSEPQIIWSRSTWRRSQTEPSSGRVTTCVRWRGHSVYEVWVYHEGWSEKFLQPLQPLEDITLCIKCQPQQRMRAKTGPQEWTHLLL